MSFRYKLRRGNTVPTNSDLETYEMGVNTDTNIIYYNNNGSVVPLKTDIATNSENADLLDGIDSTQFLRSDVADTADETITFEKDIIVKGIMYGISQKAQYADIAENYSTDGQYEYGDVIMFNNPDEDAEGTLANGKNMLLGVYSKNPAYLMNNYINAQNFAPIALAGRVPVKITNNAKRGDFIIVDKNAPGKGKSVKTLGKLSREKYLIGIAISNSFNGYVEVKI